MTISNNNEFYETLEDDSNNDIIISKILLKIVNGKYHCILVHNTDFNNVKLLYHHGKYDVDRLQKYNVLNIPIFKNNALKYNAILMSIGNTIIVDKSFNKLIELLERYLP